MVSKNLWPYQPISYQCPHIFQYFPLLRNICRKRMENMGSFIYQIWKNFRKTNIFYPLIRRHACAYQGVRNVSFSEIFFFSSEPLFNESNIQIVSLINWVNTYTVYFKKNTKHRRVSITSKAFLFKRVTKLRTNVFASEHAKWMISEGAYVLTKWPKYRPFRPMMLQKITVA